MPLVRKFQIEYLDNESLIFGQVHVSLHYFDSEETFCGTIRD